MKRRSKTEIVNCNKPKIKPKLYDLDIEKEIQIAIETNSVLKHIYVLKEIIESMEKDVLLFQSTYNKKEMENIYKIISKKKTILKQYSSNFGRILYFFRLYLSKNKLYKYKRHKNSKKTIKIKRRIKV